MKPKNTMVYLFRPFKNEETGKIEIRKVLRSVADSRDKEKGECPECEEEVTCYVQDHYEHKSRADKPCSFKTKIR